MVKDKTRIQNVKKNHEENVMKDVINSVISYVKHTQFNIKKDVEITDHKLFYKITKENGLCALVFSSMNKDVNNQNLYQTLEKDLYSYVSLDTKQLIVIQHIKDILQKAEIKFILLKGSVLKDIYKQSYMRVMGDIDILIEEHHILKVQQLFELNQIKSIGNSYAHDRYMTVDRVYIEVHPRLYHDFDPKYKPLFIDPWKYALQKVGFEYQFTKEYELVYLLYHLAKHLSSSGIGIRSILDIGLYQSKYELNMDIDILETYLDVAELKQFYLVLLELNKTLFEFTFKKELNVNIELKEEDKATLLNYIIISGLHGNGSAFNAFAARNAHYHLKNKSRVRMIFDIIFPKYKDMAEMYPYIKKIKVCIVCAWMSRWFKLIFKKRTSTFIKIKKLQSSRKNLNQTEHIMKSFGL
jgi:hypothetical protein